MQEKLCIGVVVKPQGVKGELKVMPYTDDINRFKKLKSVIIDEREYRVNGSKIMPPAVLLSLDTINDRNTAELFRGKFLHVLRKDAVSPKENSFFIVDIIGCELVVESGEKVGEIIDVTQAKTDIFTVQTDRGIMRFPFLKDLLISVDTQNKKITVKSERLNEVACYED
ncbi:MAG: 16S rRNA processing protein RimM [Clostridia bacterium]|nr:16S rRNA processing protein RimM [Clostridia bacterium]